MRSYLAIDIGASGGRHIVGWIEDGRIRTREVYRFSNGAAIRDGHLCWDGAALIGHVVAGMKACHEAGFTPESMGIDTWGVDFALLDRDGHTVGDLVAYRDDRTQGMDDVLEASLPLSEMYRLTGTAKQPFNTVYQMMAVLREHPEYRDQAADFLFMPEYLSYLLTGRKAHEWMELSTAALANPNTRTWAWEVIHAAGLPESWFETPIVEPGYRLGTLLPEIREQVGFDTTVILPATHDTGSAYMAVPARDDHAAFLSSGTWSLLGVELTLPRTEEASLRAGFTNEGGYDRTTRFLQNIMGMWMLQCLRHEDDDRLSYGEMAELAAQSDYPAYVNASDNRFLAPRSMTEEVKAALKEAGAPDPQSFGDVLRAVTMGLAVSYREAIRQMERLTGKTFTAINIVGGGSQNVTLNRFTADVTGLTVVAGPIEGTALGNLMAQMIASGEFDGLAQARAALAASIDLQVYEPAK